LKAEETSGEKLLFLMAFKTDKAAWSITEQLLHMIDLGTYWRSAIICARQVGLGSTPEMRQKISNIIIIMGA
jgi:hypothetical protein